MVLEPLVSFFHECGHYLAATVLGVSAHLHYLHVSYSHDQATHHTRPWITAAGPCVDALLAIGGFLWLCRLRLGRLDAAPSRTDWLATYFVLCAVTPVAACVGLLAHDSTLPDEASLSEQIGFPKWLLPCLLAPLALIMIVAAIRLHPRGYRLLPFVCAFLGSLVGIVVVGILLRTVLGSGRFP